MSTIRFGNMFSSFSVDDLEKAFEFYTKTLGLDVTRESMGILSVRLTSGGAPVTVYPKPDHQAATYTVLNFEVDRVESAVEALKARGVVFERYDMPDIKTDAHDISRGEEGPAIAWFRDPAGNIMSVMENSSKS